MTLATDPRLYTHGDNGPWRDTVDHLTIAAIGALFTIGIVLGLATSPSLAADNGVAPFYYVTKQAMFAVPAAAVLFFLSTSSVTRVRRAGVLLFLLALVLLAILPFVGETRNGATRWLSLQVVNLQPSELMKPAIIVFCAWMMSVRGNPQAPPGMAIAAAALGVTLFLLLIQPDYGQMALISACWAVMFFLSGASVIWAVSGLMLTVFGGLAAYAASDHFSRRIDMFFDPDNAGYQVETALSAIANGGWWGRGPGEGIQKENLPDAHSDFVIAVAAEEYGLVLTVIIIGLYALITLRAFARLSDVRDGFRRLAGQGLAALIGFQAIIHIGVSTHLLPTKGMTLPFISYGGSSLMGASIAMGMLLALTRREPEKT